MKKNDLIMMNRYCNDLHDGERVIFCKIDFIFNEFHEISKLNHDVILIIANGDITFDDRMLSLCPNNVKHIFATNTSCYNDKVTPIPIGVEISMLPTREGHGMINHGIFEKMDYLCGDKKINVFDKKDKLYSNFSTNTNPILREYLRNECSKIEHITSESGISYDKFVRQVKSHIATLSPRGNGIECVRTYEVLYLGEIPIVFGNLQEYKAIHDKIYSKLPVVFSDNVRDLENLNTIKYKINKVKKNSREPLEYEYWLDLIKKKINKIL